jgi:integrase/recombinase XerD
MEDETKQIVTDDMGINNSSDIIQKIAELKKQLPKKERKPRKFPDFVSEEEFIKIMKTAKQDHHKLAYLLAFESGMRISEIIGSKRDDGSLIPKLTEDKIDLKNRSIHIEQAKGKKDRTIALPKHFKDKYLKLLPINIGERALEKAFKNVCRKAGLLETKPKLHFHSLRHGFAYKLNDKGADVTVIRDLMGHSNVSTTNIYVSMNPKKALKSYEELF